MSFSPAPGTASCCIPSSTVTPGAVAAAVRSRGLPLPQAGCSPARIVTRAGSASMASLSQLREAYARDELTLQELETELDYLLGLKTRPVIPTNYTQIERSFFYGSDD